MVASLASVIFEHETGSTPSQSLYAALTGHVPVEPEMAANDAAEALPAPEKQAQQASAAAPANSAPASPAVAAISPVSTKADATVLALYGESESAHTSYKKAQLLPYLRDVNLSKTL